MDTFPSAPKAFEVIKPLMSRIVTAYTDTSKGSFPIFRAFIDLMI
jgi:hypothetical protein